MDVSLPKGQERYIPKQPFLSNCPRRTSTLFFGGEGGGEVGNNDFLLAKFWHLKIMKVMRLAEQSITLGGHDVPSLAANRRVWLLDTNVTQKNLGPPIEFVGGETASKRLQTLFVF